MKFALYIVASLAIISCREDLEFDGNFEPVLNVRFFNADSITKTSFSIANFEDSLSAVQERIANGEKLEQLAITLQDTIDALNPILTALESGTTTIDSVVVAGVELPILKDAMDTTFSFPLNPETTVTQYSVVLSGSAGMLDVSYDQIVTDRGENIHFELIDLRVAFTSYDSTTISCETLCRSNETTIKIYH